MATPHIDVVLPSVTAKVGNPISVSPLCIQPNLAHGNNEQYTPPLTFSISPPLPAGLSFDPATGRIYGTPQQVIGNTVYTITVTDSYVASSGGGGGGGGSGPIQNQEM